MIICKNLQAFLLKPQQSLLFKAPSLQFAPGGRYAIMGPSGCGKSVLTKYLAGLLPNPATKLMFTFEKIELNHKILYLPQDSKDSVLPWRNTSDVFKKNNSQMLDILGLRDNYDKKQFPKEMSGGELRRLALGELLSKGERDALILDEPLNGLDEDLRGRCSQAINLFMERYPKTCLIFVTHYQQEKAELQASEIRCISDTSRTRIFDHV